MYQAQIKLASLPVALILLSSGEIVFSPTHEFKTIIERYEDSAKTAATIAMDGITFDGGLQLKYNTKYLLSEMPTVTKWLQQQKLPHPDSNGEYIERN